MHGQTVEITQLQVGKDANRPVNIIVSTLAEAEFLLPMLKEHRNRGRRVNVSLITYTRTWIRNSFLCE